MSNSLEPRHGPAQMTNSSKFLICHPVSPALPFNCSSLPSCPWPDCWEGCGSNGREMGTPQGVGFVISLALNPALPPLPSSLLLFILVQKEVALGCKVFRFASARAGLTSLPHTPIRPLAHDRQLHHPPPPTISLCYHVCCPQEASSHRQGVSWCVLMCPDIAASC